MKNPLIIHDVGAANFIPKHLMLKDIIIYHFEPDKRGVENLKNFYYKSKFKPIHYEILNFALGAKKEFKKISLSKKNTASSFVNTALNDHSSANVEILVPQEIIKKKIVKQPNLVKIDVEGFEFDVIKGYDLKEDNLFCIEVEVTLSNGKLGDILTCMFNNGFELTKVIQHGDQSYVPQSYLLKKIQRYLKPTSFLKTTSGSIIDGMSGICSYLCQLELVFIKKNSLFKLYENEIEKMYGLAKRNHDGILFAGDKRFNFLENIFFWR